MREVIAVLRRALVSRRRRRLGLDVLERIWESADLDEDGAMRIAVEDQHEARRRRYADPTSK